MVGQYDIIFIGTKWTQKERGQWTVYWTSPKSFIIPLVYSLP